MHGWIHSTFQALNLVWKDTFILGFISGLFLSLVSRSPHVPHVPLLKLELGQKVWKVEPGLFECRPTRVQLRGLMRRLSSMQSEDIKLSYL